MPQRILIVDDDDDVRSFLALMFSVEGAEVREAPDAVQGLAIAEEFDPDIVVMDFMMPDMTGEQAALRLRVTNPNIWIVGFSGVDQRFGWADRQVAKGPHAYADLRGAISAA